MAVSTQLDTMSRKQKATSFLEMASAGWVDKAYRDYLTEDFRHHNPFFPAETEALAGGMKEDAAAHPYKSSRSSARSRTGTWSRSTRGCDSGLRDLTRRWSTSSASRAIASPSCGMW